jgi:hypothetical protein
MTAKPDWPSYQVGPPDSTFAIGVASIKYAQLEYALSDLFDWLVDVSHDDAVRFFAKTRNTETILSLMTARLNYMYLPDEGRERVAAFLSGFRTCNQNRNLLMHSNIHASSRTATTLYKTNADGRTVLCRPTLEELRQVADDMDSYFAFGIALTDALQTFAGDERHFDEPRGGPIPWPNIPPAPKLLDYKAPGWPADV